MTPAAAPAPMSRPVLRLSSPAALVAAVPGLLGFHPRDSLVLLALRGRRVAVTLRVDLPDEGADVVPGLVQRLARAAPGAEEVVALVYPASAPTHRDALPARGLVAALGAELDHRGLTVRDVLCVAGDRWFSYLCDDDECCDPLGGPLEGPQALRARSGLVLAGVAPLPDRVDLEHELAADDADAIAEVDAMLEARSAELTEHLGITRGGEAAVRGDRLEAWRDAAVGRLVDRLANEGPTSADVADVLLCLADVRVRDTVLWDLMHADAEATWRRAQAVLTRCVRLAPPGAVAPAACVLAVCCWQLGDGVRAGVALERALDDDGAYSLALLLHQALDAGLPPSEWRRAMAGLARDECRNGAR